MKKNLNSIWFGEEHIDGSFVRLSVSKTTIFILESASLMFAGELLQREKLKTHQLIWLRKIIHKWCYGLKNEQPKKIR